MYIVQTKETIRFLKWMYIVQAKETIRFFKWMQVVQTKKTMIPLERINADKIHQMGGYRLDKERREYFNKNPLSPHKDEESI